MNDRELKISLAELARTSPESWKKFLRQYGEYSNALTQQLVASPPDTILFAQGRAHQGQEFLRILNTCLSDTDAIAAKQREVATNVRSDRRIQHPPGTF